MLFLLMVELFLELLLDHIPAFFRMGDDTSGAVFKAGRQDTEVPRAGEQEERAVAEET
jgi:hypothetical protein